MDHTEIPRILDAAGNRTREGFRVLEDYARFALDDAYLARLLKEGRHQLSDALGRVSLQELLASRDTGGDVGTGITTRSEAIRHTSTDVLRANCKRVQEGLRTLEEFGKILDPRLGETVGGLRYQFYGVEKALLRAKHHRPRFAGRSLYLLVTGSSCRQRVDRVIRESLAAGVGIVQIREKSMPDRQLVDYGRQVRQWTREAEALLIMNDRPDLAVLVDADGVHVGQEELTVRQARRIVGPDRLVGVSTHSIDQARQAVLDGADHLGVGPVFASKTKPRLDPPLAKGGANRGVAGLDFVREVAAEITLPWFAIGGIDVSNVEEVIAAGASRIAVSNAICAAEEPGAVAQQLLEHLLPKQ